MVIANYGTVMNKYNTRPAYTVLLWFYWFHTYVQTRTPMCTGTHSQTIQYDATMHRCTREHACVYTHAHLQDLSIPFQIATFGKEYKAVNTMTIYLFHDNSGGFIDDICKMMTHAFLRHNCPSCFRVIQMSVSCVMIMYFWSRYTFKIQENKEATFCFSICIQSSGSLSWTSHLLLVDLML